VAVNAGEGISVGAGMGEAVGPAIDDGMGSSTAREVGEVLVAGPGIGVPRGSVGAVREAAESSSASGLRLQVKGSWA